LAETTENWVEQQELLEEGEELVDYLTAEGTVTPYVVNESGEKQHKSNAINSCINNKTKSSSDRIIRVQNLKTHTEPSLMVYEEDKTFKVTDTLITLVSFKRGGVGLVLLGVDQIYFVKRYVWSIDDEKFKLSRFIGKVLSFIKKSESLYWNGIYGETVSVDGSSSLTFGTKLNEELEMFIDLEALSEAKGLLEIILNNSKPVLPTINYPYSLPIENFNLSMPGLASSKEKCCVPGCSKSIKIDRMRLHVGAHIVRKDTLLQ